MLLLYICLWPKFCPSICLPWVHMGFRSWSGGCVQSRAETAILAALVLLDYDQATKARKKRMSPLLVPISDVKRDQYCIFFNYANWSSYLLLSPNFLDWQGMASFVLFFHLAFWQGSGLFAQHFNPLLLNKQSAEYEKEKLCRQWKATPHIN